MSDRNISVKDIARLAGVSVATVSRVINQNGRFSRETGERVRDIIRAYNYEPNQLARGLRTSRVRAVGVIVPDITNEFFAQITLEIQKNLFEQNYSIFICNTNEICTMEQRHLAMLRGQQVSGLIYIAGGQGGDQMSLGVPTVYIDREPPHVPGQKAHVMIESDNQQGGYMATKALIDSGCRHIAIVRLRESISSYSHRYHGYLRALEDAGIPMSVDLILLVEKVSIENAYKKVCQFTEKNLALDGIFCTTDTLAVGALNGLKAAGKDVPRDVRLIGFDDTTHSRIVQPPITTIHQATDTLGRTAATILIDMINGAEPQQSRYTIPVRLIKRGTT